MQYVRCAVLVSLGLSLVVVGQTTLRLKNRTIDTSGGVAALRAHAVQADGARVHLLLQFDTPPGELEAAILNQRGGQVLGPVDQNGWTVSIDAGTSLDGLNLHWAGSLEPADKISGELAALDASQPVVIEFHPDVSMSAARGLLVSTGAEIRDNPDLAFNHVLALLTWVQVLKIAADDSVAYVFPASVDLASGQPVVACAGAMTAAGSAGQYIATMGDGWDGPGLGQAAITYTISDMTAQLDGAAVYAEFARAMGEWSKAAAIEFVPGTDSRSTHNINIRFVKGDHSDGYAFDGRGGTLAHSFYPAPLNPEPLAGDMHFDDAERWQIGADTDLFSVAIHELGHALGLGHSDRPNAVMYPYYQRNAKLTAEDIGAIQQLYAAPAATGAPGPPSIPDSPLSLTLSTVPATTTENTIPIVGVVTGGAGDPIVAWTSNRVPGARAAGGRFWSFNAPLASGVNDFTITATDALNSTVTKTLSIVRGGATAVPPPSTLTVIITSPGPAAAYTVSTSSVSLRGTATNPGGTIAKIAWANSRGGAGVAVGTSTWDAGVIPLSDGSNSISVTATAGNGAIATATVQITYNRSAKDTTAPAITIISPVGTNVLTTASSMVWKGTAFDSVGVASVTWSTSAGDSGGSSGTTNWQTSAIPLYVGYTTVSIRASDAAGNVSWRTIQVTRR